jgi:regulatory protein
MQDDPKISALRLLARREHSRYELKQKLKLRGFPNNKIEPLLDELEVDNLLNVDRYIACFIRARCARGMGPLKICAQLQNHDIDPQRIQANEEWQNTAWEELAMRVKWKRFGEQTVVDPHQRLQQERFLQQRGFTYDQIRFAILDPSK